MTKVSEESLLNAGFKPQYFAYQIGGGEDEDDMTIFVKDNIAVAYRWDNDYWYARRREGLNYINGFRFSEAEAVESIEQIEQLKF
jgi:hypothetical protein